MNERAGLPLSTELALFEEIKPNLVERLADLDRPLEKVKRKKTETKLIYKSFDFYKFPSLSFFSPHYKGIFVGTSTPQYRYRCICMYI